VGGGVGGIKFHRTDRPLLLKSEDSCKRELRRDANAGRLLRIVGRRKRENLELKLQRRLSLVGEKVHEPNPPKPLSARLQLQRRGRILKRRECSSSRKEQGYFKHEEG